MATAPTIYFPGNLASAETLAALRLVPSAPLDTDANVLVQGGFADGDGLGGLFTWVPSSLVADNGTTTIKPDDLTSLQAGRWRVVGAPLQAGTVTAAVISNDPAEQQAILTKIGGLTSPVFTGSPRAPTAALGDKTTLLATTAFVDRAIGGISYNINSFGADPTGETFSDVAWSAACALIGGGEGCIEFGHGTYKFNTKLIVALNETARNSLCVKGQGANVTKLLWPNANGGIDVTTNGQSNAVQISDLSLLTSRVGGGTAIRITNAGSFGGGDGNFSNITRVYIAGDDKTTLHDANLHYWSDGVITTGVSNVNYEAVSIAGAGLTGLGNGITMQGNGTVFGVAHNVSKSYFYALNVGITYGTYFQGMNVAQCNFTNGNVGIFEPTGTISTDQLTVIGCQFNTSKDQIITNKLTHVTIVGNLFFLITNFSALSVQNGQMMSFQGNIVNGPATPTGTGVFVGANLSGNGSVISGNTFYHLINAVVLDPGTNGWNVQANSYVGNTSNVTNGAGASNSIGVATP